MLSAQCTVNADAWDINFDGYIQDMALVAQTFSDFGLPENYSSVCTYTVASSPGPISQFFNVAR